jgi:lipopolysaccharide/colanic/teichoic acid biosynthesis glycosyltransferase
MEHKAISSKVKRCFDLCVACVGLVLMSPALIGVALAVRIALGSPVFFRQPRPGLNGRQFQMVKFRTMSDRRDASGIPLSDEERLTHFGRWLRSTSLDELPELWNVLRGEMSVVGPRPLLMEYLPLYSTHHRRRHEVRPGITGWAQINGRNAITWLQKLDLDVWYVDHWSFWLDIRIFAMTLVKVIRREGISAGGQATISKFTGEE